MGGSQRLTFESPDARSRKTQRDLLVQGALAAQNSIKGKAPLDLPQAPALPAGMSSALGADPMATSPLAALGGGAAGGAALNGPGMAPAPPPGADPMAALMAPPPGAAPPTPAFAEGGMMGAPPTAANLGVAGPMTGEGEPRIDLPAPAPEATVATSPEPYELDPGIVTADRLIDILLRAQRGDDPNVLVADATRPRTRLPQQNPATVTQMEEERRPMLEPPGSFLRWLAATRPEDTDGVGKELVEIYTDNPDAAPDLWAIVQSGLTSEERAMLPDGLLKALKGSDKTPTASGRIPLPKQQTSRTKQRSTGY